MFRNRYWTWPHAHIRLGPGFFGSSPSVTAVRKWGRDYLSIVFTSNIKISQRANVYKNNVVPVFKCDCGVPAIWNQINVFQYSIFLTDNLHDKKHKTHSTISFPSLIAADFTFDGCRHNLWPLRHPCEPLNPRHWVKVLLNTNKNLINQFDGTGCLVALYLTYPCNIISVDKFFQLL